MENKLSYKNVCVMKWIAILMIMISHYYRFFAEEIAISPLKSIGYFGAALFAFLSGYLAEINKDKVIKMGGRKWLTRKICVVYIPYVIVNVISVFIYKSKSNILLQILCGSNDNILWYVPFVLIFYIIFCVFTILNINEKYFIVVGILIYIMLEFMGFDSQWYTSIASLICGLFIGKLIENNIQIILSGFTFMLFSFLTVICSRFYILKDLFTSVAGMSFCVLFFLIFVNFKNKEGHNRKIVSMLSGLTFWIYLIHMKVGFILQEINRLNIWLFIIITLCVSAIFNLLYSMIKNRLVGK